MLANQTEKSLKLELPRLHRWNLVQKILEALLHVPELNRRIAKYHQEVQEIQGVQAILAKQSKMGYSGTEQALHKPLTPAICFIERVLEHLHCSYELHDPLQIVLQMAPVQKESSYASKATPRPLIIVSNHPLGGRDGIVLLHFWGQVLGSERFKVLVNEFLLAVPYLHEFFLPTSPIKLRSNNRLEQLRTLERALDELDALLLFPAGLCSRLHARALHICDELGSAAELRNLADWAKLRQTWKPLGVSQNTGKSGPSSSVKRSVQNVYDLAWQAGFLRLARKHKMGILPLYISGQNSPSFYRLAQLRQRLSKVGLKFNWEMLALPHEFLFNRSLFSKRMEPPLYPEKQHLQLHLGPVLEYQHLQHWPSKNDKLWAQALKHFVCQLPHWQPEQMLRELEQLSHLAQNSHG